MIVEHGEILAALVILLVGTNGFFLARHFRRVEEMERRQEAAMRHNAVLQKTAEALEDRFKVVEARINAIYGLLVGPREHASE